MSRKSYAGSRRGENRATGAIPATTRAVGPGEHDDPAAYAYRMRDGRMYFLYRKAGFEKAWRYSYWTGP